jgi:cytochrome c55X
MASFGSRGFAPALFVLMAAASVPSDAADGEPGASRRAELVHLVRHDCGSCHGMSLQGGLGPALTAQALAQRPIAYLEQVILRGRGGTAMPGWKGLIDDSEASWIAQQLKNGFANER